MNKKTLRMAQISLMAALVIVLQVLSTVIPTHFKVSLVLIPIVLGGVYFGIKAAGILGAAFGLVVTVFTVTGVDVGAHMLFEARPILTVFLCFFKAILAGMASALVYKLVKNTNRIFAVTLAAITAPIVNTGIFCLFMFACYKDILAIWAGGTDLLFYVITALVGINFVTELITAAIICPLLAMRIRIPGANL